MAGVVIGSLINRYIKQSSAVRALAVTVNNQCNLSCPHCYLQYNGPKSYMDADIQEKLASLNCDHVALVGMEPLVNRAHANSTVALAKRIRASGKTVSLITNGFGLQFISEIDIKLFEFIDISMDGGVSSYQLFRGASYEKLINIARNSSGKIPFNALNTICIETIPHIEDTINGCPEEIFSQIFFSPYVDAKTHGQSDAQGLPLASLFKILKDNSTFMVSKRARLMVDQYHLDYEGIAREEALALIGQYGLSNKIVMVPHTPLTLGIIRVTYEGQMLPPETAIHPARYGEWSARVGTHDLQDAYETFCSAEASRIDRGTNYASAA